MTKQQLLTLVNSLPDDKPIEFRVPFKTGYDEGNIHAFASLCEPQLVLSKTVVSLQLDKYIGIAGGW